MRSSEIENACMVVRTPVARAAPAIEAAPGTVEHATRARAICHRTVVCGLRDSPELPSCEHTVKTPARVTLGSLFL